MTTTYNKLDVINDSLNDIKTAIIAKGQTPSGNITTYATAINNIPQQSAVITSLNVTPTTSSQIITASGGVDGYSPIAVSAVTSSIDANITAGNIKKDVTILGVTGSYEGSGGGSTKFGVSIDNFIGDVTNGVLGSSSAINGITFTGVTEIGYSALFNAFTNKSVSGLISFPDLTTVVYQGLQDAFSNNQITSVDLSSLTTVGDSGLGSAFSSNQITSVDLSSLTTVGDSGLNSAFYNNQITSVDLSSLTTVGDSGLGSAFSSNQITSVDLSSLTTISGNNGLQSAFSSNQIASVDLSSLTTISDSGLNSAFYGNKLVNINFSNLEHLGNYALASAFGDNGTSDAETGEFNPSLQSVSFPALNSQSFGELTGQFNGMLYGDDGVTVHFPSNLQSVIGDWDDVSNGFGGTNTTVLFDLTATE